MRNKLRVRKKVTLLLTVTLTHNEQSERKNLDQTF